MAGQDGLVGDLNVGVALQPDASDATLKMGEVKKLQDANNSGEKRRERTEEHEEEEEMVTSAHLEPSTLPWSGHKIKKLLLDQEDENWTRSEERDTGISQGGRQVLSEERSQTEGYLSSKAKWRESMPEGERWRDDEGDGSLADDEDEEGEDDYEDEKAMFEKTSTGFTPHVTIVCPTGQEPPEEHQYFREKAAAEMEYEPDTHSYPEWENQEDYYGSDGVRGEKLRLVLATAAGALLFPLLVWGGYALLPFDTPRVDGAPLRVLYTLRCAFFAIIPILLGVLVQGVARLRFSVLQPLYQADAGNKEVMLHWHYVNESLSLFLFYFLQLAVMATYISQDLVKLVPLLTVVFVFGRLIYWLCLTLDSSIRGFGFGFSFFPMLVMLGANLYYVCLSVGQDSVFDVPPPATQPPPRLRWWF